MKRIVEWIETDAETARKVGEWIMDDNTREVAIRWSEQAMEFQNRCERVEYALAAIGSIVEGKEGKDWQHVGNLVNRAMRIVQGKPTDHRGTWNK